MIVQRSGLVKLDLVGDAAGSGGARAGTAAQDVFRFNWGMFRRRYGAGRAGRYAWIVWSHRESCRADRVR